MLFTVFLCLRVQIWAFTKSFGSHACGGMLTIIIQRAVKAAKFKKTLLCNPIGCLLYGFGMLLRCCLRALLHLMVCVRRLIGTSGVVLCWSF